MARSGSGSVSENSSMAKDNRGSGLFPNVRSTNLNPLDEEERDLASEGDGNTSSIKRFRDIFFNGLTSVGDDFEEYDLASDVKTTSLTWSSNWNEMSTSADSYSLDSSILNAMMNSETHFDGQERLKYLKTYESLGKAKLARNETNESNNESVFGLSALEDFDRYNRQTELNDYIYSRMSKNMLDKNLLTVVNPSDLAEKYDINNNFEDEKVKSSKRRYPWHLIERNKNAMSSSKSEIVTDVKFNNDTASSDSERLPRTLQRKLKVRHLQMISFGGTLGVGLFLNTGKAITIAGGLGCLLAFVVCGIIVLATLFSFCEMVTFVSVIDGVSGLCSRFVDEAFGFAIGWLYFLSFALGIAGEIVASVIMLSYYPDLKVLENKGSSAGFVTLFLILIIGSNLLDVRVFGEIEYISSLIKLLWALAMIIIMIVLNRGGFQNETLGFKYWENLKSDFTHNLIFGLFRPSFNLHDNGMNSSEEGIGGNKGRFMSFLVALMITSYAYSGTEIVCIAACEAKNPRKALPSATKRVFWRVLIFYCLSAFVVSLNIYAGDPRLLRYYLGDTGIDSSEFSGNYAIKYVGGVNCKIPSEVFAGVGNGAQSPWIVALQSASLCGFSDVVNGLLIFFAVTCGNAQLYVSSRTAYSLALQAKAPKFLTYCTSYGVPYCAVLFSGSFGLISYICVSKAATSVFQNLSSVVASSGIILWFAMCLSYLRFYYGLKKRPDIMSRNDKAYPYKSPFQPYCAYVGLIGSLVLLLGMGYVVFLNGEWDTMFFFSSYGTIMFFAVLYVGYRVVRGTGIPSLEALDYDSGRREMDRYIWDGGKEYNSSRLRDMSHKVFSFLA
ncbi:uncharacterized protein PRCAT00003862001 [Priceomyces carsonii]|uniref:uncharacterized protein n=1 Tax=Priceomyces carsonii TaxID=28549 RepID=UPI002ED8FAB7|nr:unnamed protein product [Priceomyces carsonii]